MFVKDCFPFTVAVAMENTKQKQLLELIGFISCL